ncbi:MAG: hypothetical protein ACJ77U_02305, partial [Chloroflexota bacterium]
MTRRPMPLAAGLVLVALIAVLAGSQLGLVGGSAAGSPSPSSGAVAGGGTARPTAPAPTETETPGGGTPGPTRTADATTAPPTELADVPIVPVTNFRSTFTGASPKDVPAILAGTSNSYDTLALVADEAPAILSALHIEDAAPAHVVLFDDAQALTKDF